MLNEILSVVYQFYKESNLLIRNSDKRIVSSQKLAHN